MRKQPTGEAKGFTLIELLVVVAIIGILAAIIMASLSMSRQKGYDARRIADIHEIRTALGLYSNDSRGIYPATLDPLSTGGYITSIPKDPIGGTAYSYAGLSVGGVCTDYHVGASLQIAGNPALSGDIDAAASGVVCTGSGSDFSGVDLGNKCNAADAGVACYDWKP